MGKRIVVTRGEGGGGIAKGYVGAFRIPGSAQFHDLGILSFCLFVCFFYAVFLGHET